MLIVCFSCGTNNKPVSDAQKEKIKGEVKEVVNTFYNGCEEANFGRVIETCFDSPDFFKQLNGKNFTYKDFEDMAKTYFSSLINQKFTVIDEKYVILDNSTVLHTENCTLLANYKDGHSVLYDPWLVQLIFKKIDSKWKIVSEVEYGVKKSVHNESSIELNQVELNKQWMGTWKWEGANDTTIFWDNKSYGTGLEGHIRFVTKGQAFMERKEFAGYNKEYDKYISAQMTKGEEIEMSAYWFTSKNKCIQVPFEYILNPEKASYRIEIEFKSPDIAVAISIVNNKTISVDTWTRVK